MNIRAFASGSSGNAYMIECHGDRLMLDAGVRYKWLEQASDFEIVLCDGCLLSHEHQDHAKAIPDLMKHAVDVYCPADVWANLGLPPNNRAKVVEPEKQFVVGKNWNCIAFGLVHDVPCYGYVIAHTDYKLLYLTDSAYCKHTFTGLTHIMIEANYGEEALMQNVQGYRRTRVFKHHMSIERVAKMLAANDLSKCEQIYLLHLSSTNSNEVEFKRIIEAQTGIPVICCEKTLC